jgi:hypothetical protein
VFVNILHVRVSYFGANFFASEAFDEDRLDYESLRELVYLSSFNVICVDIERMRIWTEWNAPLPS